MRVCVDTVYNLLYIDYARVGLELNFIVIFGNKELTK